MKTVKHRQLNGYLRLITLLAAAAIACSPQGSEHFAPSGASGMLWSPQGLAATERYIIVANTAFTYRDGRVAWDKGFVTVIDRSQRMVIAQLPSTQLNPQDVVVFGGKVYVVNGGTTQTHRQGPVTAESMGGVDVFELESVPPGRIVENLELRLDRKDRRIGAFGSMVIGPTGESAYVGSGTRGDVFRVSLRPPRVLRGADRPIALFPTPDPLNGLTVVRRWGEGLAITNFNSDEFCISDDLSGDLSRRRCTRVGVDQQLIEGPIDVAADPQGRALVLMSVANALYRVDLDASPPRVERRFSLTGAGANRVLVHDQFAYVLNSLSNNLERIDLQSGASKRLTVFPVASNPYDMVITKESAGLRAWVTLFASHQLCEVDLHSGEILQLIGGRSLPSDEVGPTLKDAGTVDAADGPHRVSEVDSDLGPAGEAGDRCAALPGVQSITRARYGPGAGLGQDRLPQVLQSGPRGRGEGAGNVNDVLSLGVGGEIVLDFYPYEIVDGPGADFVIFENPFLLAARQPFAEPAQVALSTGGLADSDFHRFPCDLSQVGDPERWPYPGCAGVRPVTTDSSAACVDATTITEAGGDRFDLSQLPLDRARYLRLRDAGVSPLGINTKGFDLDAVLLINYRRSAER